MTSSPSLGHLQPELVDMIINHLELSDVCRLRLVARDICDKVSVGIFEQHCQHKKVNVDASQLQHAILVMQKSRFSYLLEHLTLVAIPTSLQQEHSSDPASQLTHLLQELLKTIILNAKRGCLPSLTLTVKGAGQLPRRTILLPGQTSLPIDDPKHLSRAITWEIAATCFDTTIRAIAANKLPVESLNIFASTLRYSLACDKITTTLSTLHVPSLAESLTTLRKLSLSLSPHECSSDDQSQQCLEFGKTQTNAICHFLQLCPNLTELHLHWYKSGTADGDAGTEEKHFFERIAESCRFPLLEVLILEGIHTTEAALLSFLQNVRLRRFVMDEVHLGDSGLFRPITDYLFEHMKHAELHFDNLWEARLVEFDAPGKPHFPSSGRGSGPNFIIRTGQDVSLEAIRYRQSDGYALGSSECHNWRRERRLRYGK